MSRYVLAVYSNPVEGREQEYDAWYDGRHRKDMLAMPGVKSMRRMTPAAQQLRSDRQPHRFLCLYEIETDDLQGFIVELLARAGTERMPRSPALASDAFPYFWEVVESS
jgi:hypothetical protein